jgi:hypothetical protein
MVSSHSRPFFRWHFLRAVVSEPPFPVETIPFIKLAAQESPPGATQHWLIELDLRGGVQLRIAQPR